MPGIDEEMTLFESVSPEAADVADIHRGLRLLDLIAPGDVECRIKVLHRLGSFYLENRVLDPLESIESARSCYEEVIRVAAACGDNERFLRGCSGAANTLIRRYQYTRNPDDLTKAERAFCELIESCVQAGMPEGAASCRINYAVLLMEAVHGDKFGNLDKAVGLLREAARQLSEPARGPAFDPDQYARALHNLGAALLRQAEEPHVQSMNVNEAVAVLREALEHRPPERSTVGRIHTLRALAAAYPHWTGADSKAHALHLADAAESEADALERGTAIPGKASWAILSQKRSALFRDLDEMASGPNGRANLMSAIGDHSASIDQLPGDRLPFLWAEWVGGLARLAGRIGVEDSKVEFINLSLSAFTQALQAVPVELDPRLHLVLSRELGRVSHECRQWELSLDANRRAAEIGFALCDTAGTSVSRANELMEVTRAVHFASFAAAQLNRPMEAAELAEAGRARWLDDALRAAAIRRSHIPEDEKAAVDQAQARLLELERQEMDLLGQGAGGAVQRVQDFLGMPFGELINARVVSDPTGGEARRRDDLARVRSELKIAHDRLSVLLDAASSARVHILPDRMNCGRIQNAAERIGIPVVYLLATAWESIAIIVGPTVDILPLPGIDRGKVQELLYEEKGFARSIAGGNQIHLEESLRTIEDVLGRTVIEPLAAWGHDRGIDSFAVIGLGDLGLLPLQVASVPAGIAIQLLPSARALDFAAQETSGKTPAKKLLTVGDPATSGFHRLPFSRIESLAFQATFRKLGATSCHLRDHAGLADIEAQLPDATYVHLACHGSFRPSSPLNSVIHLDGDEVLRVESLLRPALKLSGTELVVLSACNSASREVWRTPDEAIGFPAALLAAGAKTVVAAQWEVSDAATFLLMQQFCSELLNTRLNAARSLANAQRWLRSASLAELVDVVACARELTGDDEPRSKRLLDELLEQLLACDVSPCAGPRFWAGFVCVGS